MKQKTSEIQSIQDMQMLCIPVHGWVICHKKAGMQEQPIQSKTGNQSVTKFSPLFQKFEVTLFEE